MTNLAANLLDHARSRDQRHPEYEPVPLSGARPWRGFRRDFERHASRPLPILRDDLGLDPAARAALIRSLGIFLLGEAGEGRIAREIDRVQRYGVDDDYRAALKLFVREEGRHARILGAALAAYGAPRPSKSGAERLFRFGRRLLGLRTKLVVLLAAEIVSVVFYRALAERIPAGTLRAALEHMQADEARHRRFHAAFLGQACPGALASAALGGGFTAVASAACAVVAWDHRRTLAHLGVPPGDLLRATVDAIASTRAELVGSAPAPCALEEVPV